PPCFLTRVLPYHRPLIVPPIVAGTRHATIFYSAIFCSSAVIIEFPGSRRGCNRRSPVVLRRQKFPISAGPVFMFHLHMGWFKVPLAHRHFFRLTRARIDD